MRQNKVAIVANLLIRIHQSLIAVIDECSFRQKAKKDRATAEERLIIARKVTRHLPADDIQQLSFSAYPFQKRFRHEKSLPSYVENIIQKERHSGFLSSLPVEKLRWNLF